MSAYTYTLRSAIVFSMVALSACAGSGRHVEPMARPTVSALDAIGSYTFTMSSPFGLSQEIPREELTSALQDDNVVSGTITLPDLPAGYVWDEYAKVNVFYSYPPDRDVEFGLEAHDSKEVSGQHQIAFAICYGCIDSSTESPNGQEQLAGRYDAPIVMGNEHVGGYQYLGSVVTHADGTVERPGGGFVYHGVWWSDRETMSQITTDRLENLIFMLQSLGLTLSVPHP